LRNEAEHMKESFSWNYINL